MQGNYEDRIKLADFVFGLSPHIAAYLKLLYRCKGALDYAPQDSLAFDGKISFMSYFNALSIAKWRKYTNAQTYHVHLELSGDPCRIWFEGVFKEQIDAKDKPERFFRSTQSAIADEVEAIPISKKHRFAGDSGFKAIDLQVPKGDFVLVGISLESEGATEIANAYWFSEVAEQDILPVRLAITTTTFKREAYIAENVSVLQSEIFDVACGFEGGRVKRVGVRLCNR